MSNMKICSVSIPEPFYDLCVAVAGSRSFSALVRESLQAQIDRYAGVPGLTPGGECVSCHAAPAWVLRYRTKTKEERGYWCRECSAKLPFSLAYTTEDKTPVSQHPGKREQLLQAAFRAMRAVVEYDEAVNASSTKPLPETP